MKSKITRILCCILVLASLTTSALATTPTASPPVYQDVPISHQYASDIEWLTEQKIVQGCGNQCFEPDRPITTNEITILLTRAFGDENDQNDPWQTCLQNGWIPDLQYRYPSTKELRGHFYEIIFNTAGIVTYNPGLYENSEFLGYSANIIYAASGFGLCDTDTKTSEYITRGEAAYVLHQVLTHTYAQEIPEIQNAVTFKYEPEFTSRVSDALCELIKLPVSIQNEFNEQGWTFVLGDDYINAYDTSHNTKSVGLTDHNACTIYVNTPDSTVLHEFAHFLYWHCGVDIERVQAIFAKERDAAKEAVSEYSAVSSSEFFAEYFAYFISRRNNETNMKWLYEHTPLMFTYMLELEEKNWV